MMLRYQRINFVYALLASLGFLCLTSGSASAQTWAEKMFKDRSHDFRIVGRGTKSEFHFEFTNLYKEDIHVSAVRTSCGCTTPTVTKDTVKTHEKSAVVATFNTSTFIGQKSATLTVVFDRPTYAEVQLKVSGFIRTDITFDPPEVSFGEMDSGEPGEREVVITHTGDSNWEIVDVRSHCSNLKARLSPVQRAPGMVRYRMFVKLDDKMAEGDIRERLTLISNDRSFPTTEMAISGTIQPMVSVFPASVGLGTIPRDGQVAKKLVVRGKEPFEVADVLCADKRFEFEVPLGSKKVHLLKMRFTGDGTNTPISQKVQIVTDLEGDKSASCVVTGSVQ